MTARAGFLPKNWSNCDKLLLRRLPFRRTLNQSARSVWSSHVNLDHLVWCLRLLLLLLVFTHMACKKEKKNGKGKNDYKLHICTTRGRRLIAVIGRVIGTWGLEIGVCLDVTVRRFACEFLKQTPNIECSTLGRSKKKRDISKPKMFSYRFSCAAGFWHNNGDDDRRQRRWWRQSKQNLLALLLLDFTLQTLRTRTQAPPQRGRR